MTQENCWTPGSCGVFYDIEDSEYRGVMAASQSMLKSAGPTPAHMAAAIFGKKKPSTRAKILGGLTHHAILFPDKPLPLIAVRPPGHDGRTKQGFAWLKQQKLERRIVLDRDEYDSIVGMTTSIASKPICQQMLIGGRSEVSLFGNLKDSLDREVFCKARLDFLPDRGNFLPDIKTCKSAHEPEFKWDCLDWGYNVQGAFYMDLWNALNPDRLIDAWVLIAVEKTLPYAVAVYSFDYESISRGREKYKQLLTRYNDCLQAREWQAYSDEVITLSLPQRKTEETS